MLAAVNALRMDRALRPRLRRGFGIDSVCAQLGGLHLRMAAVAHNLSCRRHAGVDHDIIASYSADVFSGVSTPPLRLDMQADSGPIAAPPRDTALSGNNPKLIFGVHGTP